MEYLKALKGKPGYEAELERLKPILCDIELAELEERVLGFNSTVVWNDFSYHTIWSKLLVDTGKDIKLVTWDGTLLTEENGKTYTWDHNPYKVWAGVS